MYGLRCNAKTFYIDLSDIKKDNLQGDKASRRQNDLENAFFQVHY